MYGLDILLKDISDYAENIKGNNIEAVIEFFRDGFGRDVLDIEYLCFITLFSEYERK